MNLKENECNQYRADADASKLNFWLVSLISKLPYNDLQYIPPPPHLINNDASLTVAL